LLSTVVKGYLTNKIFLQVSMMDRDNYFGRILTGRIVSGTVRVGDKVHGLRLNGSSGEVVEVGKVRKHDKKLTMLESNILALIFSS
jgi:predicted membrane GTPase involved in stress response